MDDKTRKQKKLTNWQSRTAMVIMPSLFIFSITGEMKIAHRMREISEETEHSVLSVKWAEEQYRNKTTNYQIQKAQQQQQQPKQLNMSTTVLPTTTPQIVDDTRETERELMELYRRSVKESGLNIVPGDTLDVHHRAANFVKENPLKLLLAIAVPSVIHIFYGKSGQSHLTLSMKLMHTRLFGQFATLGLLLGIMGFKEFMDRNGKYITELESEIRVKEMAIMREKLQKKLNYKNKQKAVFQQELNLAHAEDVKNNSSSSSSTKKKKKKKNRKKEVAVEEDNNSIILTDNIVVEDNNSIIINNDGNNEKEEK